MLSSLVDGYGSSDSGSDDNPVQKSKAPTEQSPDKPEPKSTDQFNDVEPSGAKGPGSMLAVCECMCASSCLQGHLAQYPRQTVGLVEFPCFVPRNFSTRSSLAQPRKDLAAGGKFFAVCTWQAEPSTHGKWRAGEEVAAHPARVSPLDPLPIFLPKEQNVLHCTEYHPFVLSDVQLRRLRSVNFPVPPQRWQLRQVGRALAMTHYPHRQTMVHIPRERL